MTDLVAMGQAARAAGRQLATLQTDRKNAALLAIAILANTRPTLREKLREFRRLRAEQVMQETLE